MENIRAHKKEIIPRSKATIYQYNGLANHQNLRLLKRSDMSIDIKMQENTIGLNPLLKLFFLSVKFRRILRRLVPFLNFND